MPLQIGNGRNGSLVAPDDIAGVTRRVEPLLGDDATPLRGSPPFIGSHVSGSSDRDELIQGMTVEIEQETGDRLVGEVGAILSDDRTHPDGILVKLKSGVRGRVKRIGPDT
ncbi:DUF2196 domain-containing protein [Natronorubrum thiooxidans]|uniref:Uncharacterized protein n=1 Tax=Natronorubrum thiooxidans TaxID=308853 RepID=A0A1N7DJS4_9EURY|nr:DUF2196 domain-containing protein [Natronorubrum thiooxidans]SIR76092.1 conserved hypothetical protein [Natronorubrum thiooxidans]